MNDCPRPRVSRVIGLTGGLGSGKSTVARLLSTLGAEVVDADRIGHAIYAPGTVGWRAIRERFGEAVIADDGTVDRQRLGTIVFADRAALDALNAIVHPLIGEEIKRRVARYKASDPQSPLVIEAALLVEAGWSRIVDEVWVVRAPLPLVLQRVGEARGLSPAQIQQRLAVQASDAERVAVADVVIDNDGTADQLEARVRAAWDGAATAAT